MFESEVRQVCRNLLGAELIAERKRKAFVLRDIENTLSLGVVVLRTKSMLMYLDLLCK